MKYEERLEKWRDVIRNAVKNGGVESLAHVLAQYEADHEKWEKFRDLVKETERT